MSSRSPEDVKLFVIATIHQNYVETLYILHNEPLDKEGEDPEQMGAGKWEISILTQKSTITS